MNKEEFEKLIQNKTKDELRTLITMAVNEVIKLNQKQILKIVKLRNEE